jgi:hypothetical protein
MFKSQRSIKHQTYPSLKVLLLPASNRTSQTALSEKQVMTISSHNLGIRNPKLNRNFNGKTIELYGVTGLHCRCLMVKSCHLAAGQ